MKDILTWQTEKRKIRDLKAHPINPRKISKDQLNHLIASMRKFDYVELVAINLDNTVLAGHMRIRALKQVGKGKEEIEVRVPSRMLDEKEAREYVIRSNKNTGEFDWDIMANSWEANELLEWGFTADELIDKFEIDMKEEESSEKKKKTQKCPSCGHEF